jgi:hypothetical protein
LYGGETWSLALRDEHKLKVFENRVLRRIFKPLREDMTGVGEMRNTYKVKVRKHEEKRQL